MVDDLMSLPESIAKNNIVSFSSYDTSFQDDSFRLLTKSQEEQSDQQLEERAFQLLEFWKAKMRVFHSNDIRTSFLNLPIPEASVTSVETALPSLSFSKHCKNLDNITFLQGEGSWNRSKKIMELIECARQGLLSEERSSLEKNIDWHSSSVISLGVHSTSDNIQEISEKNNPTQNEVVAISNSDFAEYPKDEKILEEKLLANDRKPTFDIFVTDSMESSNSTISQQKETNLEDFEMNSGSKSVSIEEFTKADSISKLELGMIADRTRGTIKESDPKNTNLSGETLNETSIRFSSTIKPTAHTPLANNKYYSKYFQEKLTSSGLTSDPLGYSANAITNSAISISNLSVSVGRNTLGLEDTIESLATPTKHFSTKSLSENGSYSKGELLPRRRLYFNIHLKPTLSSQNNTCNACFAKISLDGKDVDPQTNALYCEYTGKYYCKMCHSNKKILIPARILRNWDFTYYPVCNFALEFIKSIYNEGVFDVQAINPDLFKIVPTLRILKLFRKHVVIMFKDFVSKCNTEEKEILLKELMDDRPHLVTDLEFYSLCDFVDHSQGNLMPHIKYIHWKLSTHIFQCPVCMLKGSFCPICKGVRRIYPFDYINTFKCKKCNTLFHKKCLLAFGRENIIRKTTKKGDHSDGRYLNKCPICVKKTT